MELGKNCKSCGSWRSRSAQLARGREFEACGPQSTYCAIVALLLLHFECVCSMYMQLHCLTVCFSQRQTSGTRPPRTCSSCLRQGTMQPVQENTSHSSIFQAFPHTVSVNEALRIAWSFRQTHLNGNHVILLLMPGGTSTEAVRIRSSSPCVSQWRIYQVQYTQ